MTNPFIPAEWGKSYDLGGATWTPNAELASGGAVLIRNGHTKYLEADQYAD